MIAIIRITGQVNLSRDIAETLKRLNLRKKYSCVVLKNPTKVELGMLEKVKDFVAFGEINEDTYKKLKHERGKQGDKFFRLHPPRKGIDSKKHFGVKKGILGNNREEINKLIVRML